MSRTRTVSRAFVRTLRYATLFALLVFAAHGAAQAGVCISAGIDGPIELPGGNIHDAGTLKLCLDRDYSPVASLHVAFIDNESLGMLTSRRDTSEGASLQPFMMFVRRDDGILQLYGYALPDDGHMNTYLLQSPRRSTRPLRVAVETNALNAQLVPAGAQ